VYSAMAGIGLILAVTCAFIATRRRRPTPWVNPGPDTSFHI
jgi:hypothetical protein